MSTDPWYRVSADVINIYGQTVTIKTAETPDLALIERTLAAYLGRTEETVSAHIERVSRNPTLLCKRCEGTGLVDDDSACGDPEHCPPYFICDCDQAKEVAYS